MAPVLTPRQRARLKADAHRLPPVVQVGQSGLTDAIGSEVDRSLAAHRLIKVRLPAADRAGRDAMAAALSERTGAAVVGQVGRVLILWRPRPDDQPLEP